MFELYKVNVDKNFETVVIASFRYAFGRRTTITLTISYYIKSIVTKLSDWCLLTIQKELRYCADTYREYIDAKKIGDKKTIAIKHQKLSCYGDDCDVDNWLILNEAIKEEIARREKVAKCTTFN